jgi:hypothetical protein
MRKYATSNAAATTIDSSILSAYTRQNGEKEAVLEEEGLLPLPSTTSRGSSFDGTANNNTRNSRISYTSRNNNNNDPEISILENIPSTLLLEEQQQQLHANSFDVDDDDDEDDEKKPRTLPITQINWEAYCKTGNKASFVWLFCLFTMLVIVIQQASLNISSSSAVHDTATSTMRTKITSPLLEGRESNMILVEEKSISTDKLSLTDKRTSNNVATTTSTTTTTTIETNTTSNKSSNEQQQMIGINDDERNNTNTTATATMVNNSDDHNKQSNNTTISSPLNSNDIQHHTTSS